MVVGYDRSSHRVVVSGICTGGSCGKSNLAWYDEGDAQARPLPYWEVWHQQGKTHSLPVFFEANLNVANKNTQIGDYIKWEDETELVGVYTTTIPIVRVQLLE